MSHKLLSHPVWRKARETDEDGQYLVEFAFTFVFFVAVLIGFAMLAVVFFLQASITHAAQQGSRHLWANPRLPADPDRFNTADEEATYIVTNTMPIMDWHLMTVEITPKESERHLGSFVAVDVYFDVPLPTVSIPDFFSGETIVIVPPMTLHARSYRALD